MSHEVVARIECLSKETLTEPASILIHDAKSYRFGRSINCDLTIRCDIQIARCQFSVECVDKKVYFIDFQFDSTNPYVGLVSINGTPMYSFDPNEYPKEPDYSVCPLTDYARLRFIWGVEAAGPKHVLLMDGDIISVGNTDLKINYL